jgi:hypothetical protein
MPWNLAARASDAARKWHSGSVMLPKLAADCLAPDDEQHRCAAECLDGRLAGFRNIRETVSLQSRNMREKSIGPTPTDLSEESTFPREGTVWALL